MKRGEVWFAGTGQGGDRPVLVLTRDPVADRIAFVVVAQITSTSRGLISELPLDASDGVLKPCVVSFDNIRTIPKAEFRRRVATLSPSRMEQACTVMNDALGCSH
jgi:mRNA interferase MazF